MSTLKDWLTKAELNPKFDHDAVLKVSGITIDELIDASEACTSVNEAPSLQWATGFVAGLEWGILRERNKTATEKALTDYLESMPEAHDTGLLDPT